MADKVGKGWFAILLGEKITYNTFIPDYILDAIFFVKPEISEGVWINILQYRLDRAYENATGEDLDEQLQHLDSLMERLDEFKDGDLTFEKIKEIMVEEFDDEITEDILRRF